jgi:hypothetical protein
LAVTPLPGLVEPPLIVRPTPTGTTLLLIGVTISIGASVSSGVNRGLLIGGPDHYHRAAHFEGWVNRFHREGGITIDA